MLRVIFILIMVFLGGLDCHANKIENILPTFKDYIQKAVTDWRAPGLAVVIVKDGQIVYQEGFGFLEAGTNKPFNNLTVVPLASLTKNFIVVVIAQLVDEGVLSWDDPVVKHLPNFRLSDPEVTQKFTIRDLLTHRSGLKHFSGDSFWELGFDADEIVEKIGILPIEKVPGTEYGYQNHMFGVASLLVEKVTGKKMAEVFKERLFEPINMHRTTAGPVKPKEKGFMEKIRAWFSGLFGGSQNNAKDEEPISENFALPHHVLGGEVTPVKDYSQMYLFNGSSGINSCASDLGLWMIFQLNGCSINGKRFLSNKQRNELLTPQVKIDNLRPDDIQFNQQRMSNLSYGIGWFLGDYSGPSASYDKQKVGAKFIGHMGGFGGVRSLMCLIPSENMGIAIISNFGGMRTSMMPESLRNKFLDLYFGIQAKDWSADDLAEMNKIRDKNKQIKESWRLQNPRSAKDLKTYVGKYKNNLYGEFEIQEKKQSLVMIYKGREVPLKHWNGDEFELNGFDLTALYSDYYQGYLEFGVEDNKATVAVINLMFEGSDNIFRRVY